MRLNIFLSWSGKRSRKMANVFSDWLPKVVQGLRPWISTKDISKGKRWFDEIENKLKDLNVGIIFVTYDNINAPWISFEAGALSKSLKNSRVCSILLGPKPIDLLEHPLGQFQLTTLDKGDILALMDSLNTDLEDDAIPKSILEENFEKYWPQLHDKMIEISKEAIDASEENLRNIIGSIARVGLPRPDLESVAVFDEGFESHSLYSAILSVAENRILVLGRKNRKLFDKDHKNFFGSLAEKVRIGFDFRCLFLDPDSSSLVLRAASKDDDLRIELLDCIERARDVMKASGLDPVNHFRFYSIQRTMVTTIVDQAVLYTPIRTDGQGRAQPLTRAGFTVIGGQSRFAGDLVQDFEEIWINSKVKWEKTSER